MSADKHAGLHPDSITIHGGKAFDDNFNALVPPMYQTSTFVFPDAQTGGQRFSGDAEGYIYSRLGNPTVRLLEERVAALEQMEDGAASATGMGAISAATMAFLRSGDHVVASDCLYGCSVALFTHMFERYNIEVSFVDFNDPEAIQSAIRETTRLVYLETPANPQLKLIDLQMVGDICRNYADLRMVVDNTFMTPLLQRPVDYGADIVLHSATKYLNGHGDVVAGVIAGRADDIALIKSTTLKDMGATMSPHDAWLILRGLKTLAVRMDRHCDNAERVAEYLAARPEVKSVFFPGLKNLPGHELVGKQMRRAGAMIAFEMKDGYQAAVDLLNHLKMIRLAVSLGDAETLMQHPASMTHSPLSEQVRETAGITPGLVRISVGLEHIDDILADLTQSFEIQQN